jgi:triphosphoribosyl-dephospho-CoA synthase
VRTPLASQAVARAFHDACLAELDALKPGNVHRHGDDDASMTVADFEASARAAAPAIGMPMISTGVRIRLAVEATIGVVGQNTNLGIILLAAPLAQAALDPGEGELQARLARVLAGLSVEDAREAYAAIRHARPGGLGDAEAHDVSAEPAVTLLEAMRAAADRDRIAWNYTHDFADIFAVGLQRLEAARARGASAALATTAVYLGFLASIPDTLIARKFGTEPAEEVRREAQSLLRMAETLGPEALLPKLSAFDRSLKERGLNPGTSADLTVATLFASALQAPAAEGAI